MKTGCGGVDLTCPIPTHIDEGNLRDKSRSQFRGTRLILYNGIVKHGFIKVVTGYYRVGSAIQATELPGATLATIASQVINGFRRSRNLTCSW